MNKEVHYEGWLIKSPPTKRIWRARWRRRWFTLKQGEIPEQFCLEYYTDRNCRKLKGVIDLDQCEQVDCGLRLENRKQKFQYMFDIKTPKRTYYLAADTEADMRDWVNCICQVCHLHDTKQSNELQEENHTALTTNNNTATPTKVALHQCFSNDILRRHISNTSGGGDAATGSVVDQQPLGSGGQNDGTYQNNNNNNNDNNNHSDSAYVNTEYTNRETLLCEMRLDNDDDGRADDKIQSNASNTSHQPKLVASAIVKDDVAVSGSSCLSSPALYLNASAFHNVQPLQSQAHETPRLAVSSNGVVRKLPEHLVLNTTPLPEAQPQSGIQPSPALSTASGPYIPISECFSGSPKFMTDCNPATPLNNLDPKFYDTPRSHNNIGLNLTNDQSYSPKITNCSLQQISATKNRSHRSDSDSESVFTDDDEWTHPMPLRENVDRSTRPSDSSVENESFVVLTFSQRFSKLPDDAVKEQKNIGQTTTNSPITVSPDPLDKLAKVLKNKNNLILDFKDNEKPPRDNIPQLSDTENTSPAIGPRNANSVVDESYDIPRSHQLPYCNMGTFMEHQQISSPEVTNPIAGSTPNLLAEFKNCSPQSPATSANVRTLPRPHCYTNAAPSKVEGNVFRYDFIEQQTNLPPVNRRLKPKVNIEDKPPDEVPAKPPITPAAANTLATKFSTLNTSVQSSISSGNIIGGENTSLRPPSVDRKSKPIAYKFGNSATMGPSVRRSTGIPLSMVLPTSDAYGGASTIGGYGDNSYIKETRTLPRQPRPNYATSNSFTLSSSGMNTPTGSGTPTIIQHQRTASAAAAMQMLLQQPPARNEHKLQYFDLDVANPPSRQSMSIGNLNMPGVSGICGSGAGGGGKVNSGTHNSGNRLPLPDDPSTRTPIKSSVVYNSVDFVKTEAFKRIREERKKESEGINNTVATTK